MGNTINSRELILEILLAVTQDGAYSHLVIRNTLDKYQYLEKQERKFIKRVCEGTLEHMIWIDYVIDQFSKVKVRKMKPVIRCILRSSVYELKYMDAVPASATCNEAVKLAQKKGFHNLKGFVNGVLRNINRGLFEISLPDQEKEPLRYLSIVYSMPVWILELWRKSYHLEQIEEFLQAFLTEMPTSIRVNTLRTSKEELRRELEQEKIRVLDVEGMANALQIQQYDRLEQILAFREGRFYVQDISSMQAALWAEPAKDSLVLDVCAAPGGKSIHMAELMQGTGVVEARDLTQQKVCLIQENVMRCGLKNVYPRVMDARILDQEKIGKADIVMADLPCSGLGVLGKKADIKYRVTGRDCRELSKLQREILKVVQQYVKPGGTLLYSTCTINPGENEENTAWFLKEHPEFFLEKQQQILPQKGKQDGFFLAKFIKSQNS
ncbi:MAG: 16S rRNA (cytosine(967)-C(5))-methyltransferase RsmB [Lachnospiraceae bacterium]|nr:16S rRNA (cytosine(967)-C(5))-methyltransferase RsmB [Lachnospiraceae bacterium]